MNKLFASSSLNVGRIVDAHKELAAITDVVNITESGMRIDMQKLIEKLPQVLEFLSKITRMSIEEIRQIPLSEVPRYIENLK
jgi:hypothetical protein